jgi:hypothetical protein
MLTCMKNLIRKIGAFLKKLTGKAFELLRNNASLAVEVTNRLKTIVESGTAGTVVELIPGKADDAALAVLRKVLPIVANKLALVFGALKENANNADAVEAIIEKLKALSPELRGSFYLAFSAELSAALSDGKISLAEAASLAQMLYIEAKAARS